jgi:predicted PurR-regulated permease PerM
MLGHFFGNHETISGLADKLAEILTDIRSIVPAALLPYVPESLLDLKEGLAHTLKIHGNEISTLGKESLHTLAHILIAIVIGVILTLRLPTDHARRKPLANAMYARLSLLSDSFANVVFAQARISAINTCLTALYLLAVLPLCGIHLPYAKTLVIATFFAGLLPIVGNLISNTLIVLVSLGVSFKLGMWSLLFLVGIHKLEYFINARIVGARIHAAAWELLLAMLVMESAFGVPGLLVAPIVYAYLKAELVKAELV